MSDIMQFVRELLKDKSPTIGVRGIVTYVLKVPTPDPTDPVVYEYQKEVNGYLYSGFGCTRDPDLQDMQVGDEILSHNAGPDDEGYPTFLILAKAPAKEEKKAAVKKAEVDLEQAKNESNVDPDSEDPPAFDAGAKDEERKEELVAA